MDLMISVSLHSILILFSISIIFLFSISSKQHQSQPSNGLRPCPIVGNLPQFLRHRHRFLDWMAELLAASPTNTISFRILGNVRGIITANPSNVEHILKTNFDNYPKGPRFIHHLQDFLGRGIFNVDGHLWRVQRKIVSFEFNTRSLRNFVVVNVQHEILSRLLPLLHKSSLTGAAIDLQDVLERFAFDNICKFAFNEDPACLPDHVSENPPLNNNLLSRFAQAFKSAAEISAGRFINAIPRFWIITRLLNIGSERQLRESIAMVHAFATQIIRSRKKEKKLHGADDLLSRFISNEDNSDEFIRDIIISFIFAGRDGTSSALTWFFWLLSRHPEVEHKILQEISAVRAARQGGDNTETFEFEELREMQYLHAAISEAMRLYPPVFVNSTMCQSDDVLPDGTLIKKGMFMIFSAYCMGRMESIWGKDCLEFKPERWLDGEGAFRHESPYRYPVFHAGARMCLGKEMAYIQMKSIAACVLERFMVDVLHKDKEPERVLSLTLRMKHGLLAGIRDRN